MSRRLYSAALAVACTLSTRWAFAQPAAVGAMAETLFRDGKTLMAEGNYTDACPKLVESYKLDAALGALLAAGLCHEKEGKTATAWTELLAVDAQATKTKDPERSRVARAHLAELEPRLSRVALQISPALKTVEGLVVLVDATQLPPAAWDITLPVDPGLHVFEATAPGRQAWRSEVNVTVEAATSSVVVPMLPRLEAEKTETAPPPAAPAPSPQKSTTLRNVGLVVGGVGLVSLATGIFFGSHAISQNDDAKALCDPSRCTSPRGLALNDDARTSATVSTITVAAGLAAIAAGAVMIFVLPPRAPERAGGATATAALRVTPGGIAGVW